LFDLIKDYHDCSLSILYITIYIFLR